MCFLEKHILPLVEKPILIQRYPTLRAVVPNQAKLGRKLSYHQGIFVGNGTGLRTIWLPVTRAFDSNTMWMVNSKDSKDLTRDVLKYSWDAKTFEEICSEMIPKKTTFSDCGKLKSFRILEKKHCTV